MNEDQTFSSEFLMALSSWQNGWRENQERRREIADALVKECENIPKKFRNVTSACYRKRFLIEGEVVPIILDNRKFEGIASWTTDLDYVKNFKGLVKPGTKFAVIFKHNPTRKEIVININSLWEDDEFLNAAKKFKAEYEDEAKALYNFKDNQSEVILRSTLKGSEIEDIVGISSSFDELCDLANIPEEKREELSIKYARDPDGIPIEIPVFAGRQGTREAVKNTIVKMKDLFNYARINNISINWGSANNKNQEDERHLPK